ncbi:MAG: creatininase family protein [Promethearchaeota archaeon]|nr:MAG: creatininase family protein [Candidatus Lokiarchaeota archaeon]
MRRMKYLNYLNATWEEFDKAVKESHSLILIPVGCLEEHGPHLPLSTDCIIGEKICEQVAQETDIIVGPPIRFGVSRTTQGFPGTLEIRIDTLRALTYDIVYSFASQDVKTIVLFTWHGGVTHSSLLREASIDVLEKIREERNLPKNLSKDQLDSLPHIYLLSGVRMFDGKLEEEILSILETKPYHAAELETSLMLYIAPDLVKSEKLRDLREDPEFPEGRIFMRGNPWLQKGLMGDASKSNAEKGKKIFTIFVTVLSERIRAYLKE